MRYGPRHKVEIHRKIVSDASRRVRAEGWSGAPVSAVMRDAGLTHGGFYKHFGSKEDLLLEALRQAFDEVSERLARAAEISPPGAAWKAVVRTYLSLEHCDRPAGGCPLAALASELARADRGTKLRLLKSLSDYRDRILPFMPGRQITDRQRNFLRIFSTMVGAVSIARILPGRAARAEVLSAAQDFLLRSFPARKP